MKYSLVLILIFLFGCNHYETDISNDYKVISDYINELLDEGKDLPMDSLYICDSTKYYLEFARYIKSSKTLKDSVPWDLVKNFIETNKSRFKYDHKFYLKLPYRLITYYEIDMLQEADIDSKLFQNWVRAGGVKYFSRVGYNDDHNEAIFYYSAYAGPLSGIGSIVYMEKRRNNWSIKKSIFLWIS